jgi:hypothetical protein
VQDLVAEAPLARRSVAEGLDVDAEDGIRGRVLVEAGLLDRRLASPRGAAKGSVSWRICSASSAKW